MVQDPLRPFPPSAEDEGLDPAAPDEAPPGAAPGLLLQVAAGFVFALFLSLVGLMALAVVRGTSIARALPGGGGIAVAFGGVLLALLVITARTRDRARNRLLVSAIVGIAAVGLALLAGRAWLLGLLGG